MSLPADRLEAFIGGGPLPPDAIRELARVLFHGFATWDELTDRLKPPNHQEARPLGWGRQTPITDEMNLPDILGRPPWARSSARDAAEGGAGEETRRVGRIALIKQALAECPLSGLSGRGR